MKINNKEYRIPELNFSTICALEDMGASLTSPDKKVFSTIRAVVALAMGGDLDLANKELQAHLMAGGKLDEVLAEMTMAMEESNFFHSMKAR